MTKQEIIGFIESILPDPPYVSYVDLKPSWLRDPQGERIAIDLFYPELPLAILIFEELKWKNKIRSKQWTDLKAIQQSLQEHHIPVVCIYPNMILDKQLFGNWISQAAEAEEIHQERLETILGEIRI